MEQNNSTRRVISLLVDNSNGVLARISTPVLPPRLQHRQPDGLSHQRPRCQPASTVTLRGTEQALNQLRSFQTERLEVTRQIFELDPDKSLPSVSCCF